MKIKNYKKRLKTKAITFREEPLYQSIEKNTNLILKSIFFK